MPAAPLLTVAVSSSALFDLSDGDAVFRDQGREAYRRWVREREDRPPPAGPAFPFVRRLLTVNQHAGRELVEVVLISRNDPDTGLRVRAAIDHHGLPMRRAVFTGGRAPWPYIEAFGAQLFLSASARDVADAMAGGHPAGLVLGSGQVEVDDGELRIAFDFDGVLASDEGERLYREHGLEAYRAAERELRDLPLAPGPLKPLLDALASVQRAEAALAEADAGYRPVVRTAILTARTAPADRRVFTTLRAWGVRVDESFFVGDLPKELILARWRPHLFCDDRKTNAERGATCGPSVHIPFGVMNGG